MTMTKAAFAGAMGDGAMRDKFRFLVTDAAEGVVLHEALMSYRNRDAMQPSDTLRAEAADRLLARLDYAVSELANDRRRESEVQEPGWESR